MAVGKSLNDATLNELSTVIGELRNFAQQQITTNAHMLEELKKISERMTSFGEVGATFVEYRKTLHERFGKIHEQIGSMDQIGEKLQERVSALEVTVATWKGNWKLGVAIIYVISTFSSAIIANYGTAIIKAIVH